MNGRDEDIKLVRLEDIPEGETITLYQHGDFVDLCRGPHVSSTKENETEAISQPATQEPAVEPAQELDLAEGRGGVAAMPHTDHGGRILPHHVSTPVPQFDQSSRQ